MTGEQTTGDISAVQYILYEGDGVEVLFSDGRRLQLSPCGTTFTFQQLVAGANEHPIQVGSQIQQKTQFATSSFKRQVKDAVDFRNRFAQFPFLCRELLEPEQLMRSQLDVFEAVWPAAVTDSELIVLKDGTLQLESTNKVGTKAVARLWLGSTRLTFIVQYLCKLPHPSAADSISPKNLRHMSPNCDRTLAPSEQSQVQFNSRMSNDNSAAKWSSPTNQVLTYSSNNHVCDEPIQFVSQIDDRINTSAGQMTSASANHSSTSPCSLQSLRRVIDFSDTSDSIPQQQPARKINAPLADNDEFSIDDVPAQEYGWVTQHFTLASYPDRWSHPVKLLLEFCNDKRMVKTSLKSAVSCDLPKAMPLRCTSPHLHRWNPTLSDDFCSYFHSKVQVIAIRGTVYRLLWNGNHRTVEVYPTDGSVLKSTSSSGHHFSHFVYSVQSNQVGERTYSALSPPPLSTDLTYSVSRLVAMAHRLFELMSDKFLDVSSGQCVCWQTTAQPTPSVDLSLLSSQIVDECVVPNIGRFKALTDGSIHVVFNDRTCLDMHGIQWESHVFRKLLRATVSDDELEGVISHVKWSQRTNAWDFPSDVCRLLLPNGYYQHVDILQPHEFYERYVTLAVEYAMWVNTPVSQRQSFYTEHKNIAEVELKKSQCFSHLLDRFLSASDSAVDSITDLRRENRTPAVSLPFPESGQRVDRATTAVQNIAQQASARNTELLKDLDNFLLASERLVGTNRPT